MLEEPEEPVEPLRLADAEELETAEVHEDIESRPCSSEGPAESKACNPLDAASALVGTASALAAVASALASAPTAEPAAIPRGELSPRTATRQAAAQLVSTAEAVHLALQQWPRCIDVQSGSEAAQQSIEAAAQLVSAATAIRSACDGAAVQSLEEAKSTKLEAKQFLNPHEDIEVLYEGQWTESMPAAAPIKEAVADSETEAFLEVVTYAADSISTAALAPGSPVTNKISRILRERASVPEIVVLSPSPKGLGSSPPLKKEVACSPVRFALGSPKVGGA